MTTVDEVLQILPKLIDRGIRARETRRPTDERLLASLATVAWVTDDALSARIRFDDDDDGTDPVPVQLAISATPGDRVVVLHKPNGAAWAIGRSGPPTVSTPSLWAYVAGTLSPDPATTTPLDTLSVLTTTAVNLEVDSAGNNAAVQIAESNVELFLNLADGSVGVAQVTTGGVNLQAEAPGSATTGQLLVNQDGSFSLTADDGTTTFALETSGGQVGLSTIDTGSGTEGRLTTFANGGFTLHAQDGSTASNVGTDANPIDGGPTGCPNYGISAADSGDGSISKIGFGPVGIGVVVKVDDLAGNVARSQWSTGSGATISHTATDGTGTTVVLIDETDFLAQFTTGSVSNFIDIDETSVSIGFDDGIGNTASIGLADTGVSIQGVVIDPTGGADGQVLTRTSSGHIALAASAGGTPSGAAGGALDGTYPNPGLAASVAGAGLAETSDVLSVNVDGSTIEINTDTLRVKSGVFDAAGAAAAAQAASQPLDADLTTIAGLTATTNNFIVSVASAWASRTPAQVKTTLAIANTDVSGLGTMSTQNANAVAITGGSVTGITDLVVGDGGTGVSTLAAHGIILGNGASAVAVLGPDASTTKILQTAGASADPAFVSISGDASLAAGGALTLASVLTAGGPTGSATVVPIITWDAKGRLTAVSSATITGTVPGGSAGGDLSGTYPNPGVAKINGVAYNADPLAQYALLAGRSGGQTLDGGTATADHLVLNANSTAHTNYDPTAHGYIEVNDWLSFFTQNPTFTARPHFIYCGAAIVLNNASGGADMGDLLNFAPTLTTKASGNANGMAAGLNFAPTFVNDAAVAANFTSVYALLDQTVLKADTQLGLGIGTHRSVWLKPHLTTVNSGTITSGTYDHITVDQTIDAGVTISQRRALVINAATGAGTVTTEIGLYNNLSSTLLGNVTVGASKFGITASNGNFFSTGQGAVVSNFWVGNLSEGSATFDVVAASGNTTVGGTLLSTGNFTVGATKFVVTAASGNWLSAGQGANVGNFWVGNLSEGSATFDVVAASGNTTIGGTLDVAGAINASLNKSTTTAFTKANNTLATLYNVTGLLNATTYRVRLVLYMSNNATPSGFKVQLTAAASLTASPIGMVSELTDLTVQTIQSIGTGAVTAFGSNIIAANLLASHDYLLIVEGIFTTTHAGTLNVSFAQNTTNAATCQVNAGSHFELDIIQ